tara:strand:+ start:682 stop:1089 length:408 start_codon:yes stop_codon:yes gene_type:complete
MAVPGLPGGLIGPDAEDSPNTDGNCVYPAKALGGEPTKSPNIKINNQEVKTYDFTSSLDTVTEHTKVNPFIPLPCIDGKRKILEDSPKTNESVYFNGKLPAVMGDSVTIITSTGPSFRLLTGPTQFDTIKIGTRT